MCNLKICMDNIVSYGKENLFNKQSNYFNSFVIKINGLKLTIIICALIWILWSVRYLFEVGTLW